MDIHDQQIALIGLEEVNQKALEAKELQYQATQPSIRMYHAGRHDGLAAAYARMRSTLEMLGVDVPQD